MAKKSKKSLSVLSTALTGATLVVDFYNSYIYRSKNRKLSYISVGLGLVDVVLSFYLSLGAKANSQKHGLSSQQVAKYGVVSKKSKRFAHVGRVTT